MRHDYTTRGDEPQTLTPGKLPVVFRKMRGSAVSLQANYKCLAELGKAPELC
jgi:hypothetical protein